MNDLIRKVKQKVNLNTNNWRKMHGLPMLRRRNKTFNRQFSSREFLSTWNLKQIENPTLFVEVDDFESIKRFYTNKNT